MTIVTPKHFSDRFIKVNYSKKLCKKKGIERSPLSPGMQEHIPEDEGKSEKCTYKNIQIVHSVIKSVGRIVNPMLNACR